ncbi:MAG: hypothetical protein ACKV19_22165 [Verrucomicrobiales bacterium]
MSPTHSHSSVGVDETPDPWLPTIVVAMRQILMSFCGGAAGFRERHGRKFRHPFYGRGHGDRDVLSRGVLFCHGLLVMKSGI